MNEVINYYQLHCCVDESQYIINIRNPTGCPKKKNGEKKRERTFNHWYFYKPKLTRVTVATHRSVSFKSVKMVLDIFFKLLVISQEADDQFPSYYTHSMSAKCAFRKRKMYGCGCPNFEVMSSLIFYSIFWDTLYSEYDHFQKTGWWLSYMIQAKVSHVNQFQSTYESFPLSKPWTLSKSCSCPVCGTWQRQCFCSLLPHTPSTHTSQSKLRNCM